MARYELGLWLFPFSTTAVDDPGISNTPSVVELHRASMENLELLKYRVIKMFQVFSVCVLSLIHI